MPGKAGNRAHQLGRELIGIAPRRAAGHAVAGVVLEQAHGDLVERRLVALRKADLAYLHVHALPLEDGRPVRFMTEFPDAGTYRLFLQFKDGGRVHTAAFTQAVHD